MVERDGHSVEALVGLAWVISARNPSEAIEYVQQAIEIDPLNDGAYRALGSSYERLGRYDESRPSESISDLSWRCICCSYSCNPRRESYHQADRTELGKPIT